MRNRVLFFNTFFFKKLTQNGTSKADLGKMYQTYMKRWTKNVNIFEKDFIIVPVNQSAHWFLFIICFPGLRKAEYDNLCTELKEASVDMSDVSVEVLEVEHEIDEVDDDDIVCTSGGRASFPSQIGHGTLDVSPVSSKKPELSDETEFLPPLNEEVVPTSPQADLLTTFDATVPTQPSQRQKSFTDRKGDEDDKVVATVKGSTTPSASNSRPTPADDASDTDIVDTTPNKALPSFETLKSTGKKRARDDSKAPRSVDANAASKEDALEPKKSKGKGKTKARAKPGGGVV